MLTIEQIRAARALLDWSQSDLADKAGLSQTGIARIENGTNQPNTKTIQKIMGAFDKAGIEFIGDSGVKKRSTNVRTFKGKDGFRTFMDDVYEKTRDTGKDICLFNGVPEYFYKLLGKEWYEAHAKRMSSLENKPSFKIIVQEGNELFIANDIAEYRWFPETLFNEQTFYAYGNSLAFLSFDGDNVGIRVFEQNEIANSYRILFNIAWNHVAVIPEEKKSNTEAA